MSAIESEISGLRARLQELGRRVTDCSTEMQKLRAEISYLVREMADATVQLNEVEGMPVFEVAGTVTTVGAR